MWQVFEPLLFGLVGAEVSVEYMNTKVVGEFHCNVGAICAYLLCCCETKTKLTR